MYGSARRRCGSGWGEPSGVVKVGDGERGVCGSAWLTCGSDLGESGGVVWPGGSEFGVVGSAGRRHKSGRGESGGGGFGVDVSRGIVVVKCVSSYLYLARAHAYM